MTATKCVQISVVSGVVADGSANSNSGDHVECSYTCSSPM